MEIPVSDLIIFAALLGASLVIMVGFGIRTIFVSFRYEGRERVYLVIVGLSAIIIFGGFFLYQLVRVVGRF